MNEINEFKVSWCEICDQGWVKIEKDAITNNFCVACEECESEWDHPLHARLNINIKPYNEHLLTTPTLEEVQSIGWDEYIIKE